MSVDRALSGSEKTRALPLPGLRTQATDTFAFRRDQVGFLRRALAERGDVVPLRILGFPLVFVNHPDDVHRVLVDNRLNYDKESLLYRTVRPVLRNGLIGAVGGEAWHRQRRLMQPEFHRPKVAAFFTNMTEESVAMLDRWEGRIGRSGDLDMAPEIGHLALRIVTRSLFGADAGSTEAIEHDFTTANRLLGNYFRFPFPPLSVPTPNHVRIRRLIQRLDTYIDFLIDQRRRRDFEGHDLLTLLANARDEDTGYQMSSQQLHEEVLNIMVGGYETTTNAALWMLYRAASHPDVQERVQEELDSKIGARTPTFEDLTRLTYTRMVVDETIRLNTPAWQTMRRCISDDVLGGFHVPGGSDVYINFLTLHRHPDIWPDPDRFDPDRFLPENVKDRPRYAYIPFASGPRNCIGKHFALAELMIIVISVLQRYRVRLADGHPPVTMQPLITLRPNPFVRLHVEHR